MGRSNKNKDQRSVFFSDFFLESDLLVSLLGFLVFLRVLSPSCSYSTLKLSSEI